MLSAQPVIKTPRIFVTATPEAARIYKAIAKHPSGSRYELIANVYERGDRALLEHDIAEMSLACSEGLPHNQGRDRVLVTLRDWTRLIGEETEKWWGEFAKDPVGSNSPNRYRMVVMCAPPVAPVQGLLR